MTAELLTSLKHFMAQRAAEFARRSYRYLSTMFDALFLLKLFKGVVIAFFDSSGRPSQFYLFFLKIRQLDRPWNQWQFLSFERFRVLTETVQLPLRIVVSELRRQVFIWKD